MTKEGGAILLEKLPTVASDKAQEASMDIIMKWNDLPEANAKKYLETKFDSADRKSVV